MAQLSQLKIYLSENPLPGFIVRFSIGGFTFNSIAVTIRTQPQQFTIGANTDITLINLKNALVADYFNFYFTSSFDTSSELILTVNNFGDEFEYITDRNQVLTSTQILFDTYTEEIPPALEMILTGYTLTSHITDKCNLVHVAITQENGVAPFSHEANILPIGVGLEFDLLRRSDGFNRVVIITDSDDNSDTISIPNIYSYLITGVDINYSLSGATIIIKTFKTGNVSDFDPGIQYSLDGITYQTSPSYSGLLEGSYTAYIVDGFGCIKTLDFDIQEITDVRPEPYFNIEDANPLRFVTQPSTPFEFKTFENTLFNELIVSNIQKRFFRQPFNLGDVVKTQIKTNYRDLELNIIDCSGDVIETLVPELKIQNVGLKDKRDCIIKPGAAGKINVAFISGNIYNPDTDAIISTFFVGNGRLPAFAQVGMYVILDSISVDGLYFVEAIVFDSALNAWVLQVDGVFIASQETGTCISVYNQETFDIYEVNFTLPQGQYHAEIDATDVDPNYPAIIWKSEPFFFDTHEGCVTIDYRSNEGMMNIDYRTLINYRLVVPGRFYKLKPTGDDESFSDDNGNKQLQKSVYVRQLEIETSYLPWYLAEKVILAACHKDLKINGIEVVMVAKPEMESKADQNNPFYMVKGQFEQKKKLLVTESTGIISGQRYVLAVGENTILEL